MKSLNNLSFNVWENYSQHVRYLTLEEVYESIKLGEYRESIEQIRKQKSMGNLNLSNQIKNDLPAITISGNFNQMKNRSKENLVKYYGLAVFDIDKLYTEEMVKEIFAKIISFEETLMAFVSPSGLGIKFIIATNNKQPKEHSRFYQKLAFYYQDILEVPLDIKTCDVSRLCFLSYDPNIYYNPNSIIFNVNELDNESSKNKEILSKVNIEENDVDDSTFELQMKCVFEFTSNLQKFEDGNRNSFVYLFAKNSNSFGLNMYLVREYCKENFVENGFSVEEVSRTVKSSYENNKEMSGKWKLVLNKLMKKYDNTKNKTTFSKQISESPINIKDLYLNNLRKTLPKELRDFTQNFKTEKEKEAFLIGRLISLEIELKNLSVK